MVIAKGNNGQAARKVFLRRLTTVGLACAVITFGLFLLGVGQGVVGQGEEEGFRTVRLPAHRPLRDKPEPTSGKREKRSILSMLGGSGKDRMIEVDLDDFAQLEPLLSAEVHLVDITMDFGTMNRASEKTYAGISAEFCQLDWAIHKKDPSSVPMFRHLVESSSGCKTGTHYSVDLKAFAKLARAYDARGIGNAKALNLTGVVFHESRCGSTLVANALTAMNPKENRVYSESAPPITALKSICGEKYQSCSVHQAAQILADTIYLMSRSNDPQEKRVFFKIQSVGALNIEVFQNAFPRTPWIFVYRDPVQVMMSQLKMGAKYANCVRGRGRPNQLVTELAHAKDLRVRELTDEQFCAAHLGTITESAVDAMQRQPHLGSPVNYVQLPDILYKDILPNKFGVKLSQEEIDNIVQISGVYSKGTGGRSGEFKSDSEAKEHSATTEVKEAAHLFMDESYAILEGGGIKKKAEE